MTANEDRGNLISTLIAAVTMSFVQSNSVATKCHRDTIGFTCQVGATKNETNVKRNDGKIHFAAAVVAC